MKFKSKKEFQEKKYSFLFLFFLKIYCFCQRINYILSIEDKFDRISSNKLGESETSLFFWTIFPFRFFLSICEGKKTGFEEIKLIQLLHISMELGFSTFSIQDTALSRSQNNI
jgi:hypothetical protein